MHTLASMSSTISCNLCSTGHVLRPFPKELEQLCFREVYIQKKKTASFHSVTSENEPINAPYN